MSTTSLPQQGVWHPVDVEFMTDVGPRPYPDRLPTSKPARPRNVRQTSHVTEPGTQSDVESNNSGNKPLFQPVPPFLDEKAVEARARPLTRFFDTCVLSSDWELFDENGMMRIVYIGTETANLHHLVRNHEPAPREYTHYPFPPLRDPLPWRPQASIVSGSYLTVEALNDLTSFPSREVRDALIDSYFNGIHPGFPIIDEGSFRRQYADPTHPPPLLVFHAVLLAAARICNHPMVAACRSTVTAVLFRRTRALFELRYENDRSHLVQAACLMAWHVENSDTAGSNAYYWIGTAVRIAFGIGMHRKGRLAYLPVYERRVPNHYKKVWWSLLHFEVFLALEFGRPCMIRLEDIDTEFVTDEDFQNTDDSEDALVQREYFYVVAELSILCLEFHRLQAPGAQPFATNTLQLDDRLAELALRIPPSEDFWSCQLRLFYNLVVLIVKRINGSLEDSRALCFESASNILTTFETMSVQGTIQQCSPTSLQAVMAAAIQFFQEVRSAIAKGSVMKAISAKSQLERLCSPANALTKYWPNMETVCKLCVSLGSRAEAFIKECQTRRLAIETQDHLVDGNISWQDIMADFQAPILEPELEQEIYGWINASAMDTLG